MPKKPSENKVTSKPLASKLAKQLPNPSTPKKYRPAIASALGQAYGKKGK